ncbi:hypothetical protein [Pseudocitrobacter cyperus]|uniref:Uncharacterized protein n=1 Tax=Pseudocitrobacter cyperus TaxID=3112843 RepID=A0ABV0HME8_9ENTR
MRSDALADRMLAAGRPDAYLDLFDQLVLDAAIHRLLNAPASTPGRELLHQLLLSPVHRCHQQVVRRLRQLAHPDSVVCVEQVLKNGFDYLAYTGLTSAEIATWFSRLLWAIGTPRAFALIRVQACSADEGIRTEMTRWLKRIAASETPQEKGDAVIGG